MRAATVFNFLIEATLMGSVMILMMMAVRSFLRPVLGSRMICTAWVLVAIRLLVPLSLPNPMMNELRPAWSDNVGVRPIADQIRVRANDAMRDLSFALSDEGPLLEKAAREIQRFNAETSYGHTARWLLLAYGIAAMLVVGGMVWQNARFMRRNRLNRVHALEGAEAEIYRSLCRTHKVKPVPVYWVDPLPSACVIGVFRPWIALPLILQRSELAQVLAHEICHLKGGDPVRGLVRNACCAVHWFNPLVWLAAQWSRTDQELACDERVTAEMEDEERLRYASTLALAAARRNAPELTVLATGMTMKGKEIKRRIRAIVDHRAAVRWLCMTALCVAVLGTLFSFGTSEQLDRLEMPVVPPLQGEALQIRPVSTEEEAIQYAQEILATAPYLSSPSLIAYDTFDMLDWRALHAPKAGAWQVSVNAGEEMQGGQFEIIFDEKGSVWQIDDCTLMDEMGYGKSANPTYRTNPKAREPIYRHVREYASFVMPEKQLGDMYIDADYWLNEKRYVTVRSGNIYFHVLMEEQPYICSCRLIGDGYADLHNALYDARQEQKKQAQAEAVRQASEEADTVFLKYYDISEETALNTAAIHAHNYLTEVYGYSLEAADEFVFGLQLIDGRQWCVYFDPQYPEWKYMYAVDDRHGTAVTPYRQKPTDGSEGALRYFLDLIYPEGWLQGWNEQERNAFADESLNDLHDLALPAECLGRIREGTMTREEALKAVFEETYGDSNLWSEAQKSWFERECTRFDIR